MCGLSKCRLPVATEDEVTLVLMGPPHRSGSCSGTSVASGRAGAMAVLRATERDRKTGRSWEGVGRIGLR